MHRDPPPRRAVGQLPATDLNAGQPGAARGALEVANQLPSSCQVERAHCAGGPRDMVEWRRSDHVLGRPLPRHFQQRLRFVAFEALKLRDLRSGEPVGHLAPSSGGVVGRGHGVQCVRPGRCGRESKVMSWVYLLVQRWRVGVGPVGGERLSSASP
jgi:hypothetical protein